MIEVIFGTVTDPCEEYFRLFRTIQRLPHKLRRMLQAPTVPLSHAVKRASTPLIQLPYYRSRRRSPLQLSVGSCARSDKQVLITFVLPHLLDSDIDFPSPSHEQHPLQRLRT